MPHQRSKPLSLPPLQLWRLPISSHAQVSNRIAVRQLQAQWSERSDVQPQLQSKHSLDIRAPLADKQCYGLMAVLCRSQVCAAFTELAAAAFRLTQPLRTCEIDCRGSGALGCTFLLANADFAAVHVYAFGLLCRGR